MSRHKYKVIEYHLYNYRKNNYKIQEMNEKLNTFSYNHSYDDFIKSGSSKVEKEAFRRIALKEKISIEEKWQETVGSVLQEYKNTDKEKYRFLILKYVKKMNKSVIQRKMKLNFDKQKDMRREILNHVFFCALENNLIKNNNKSHNKDEKRYET